MEKKNGKLQLPNVTLVAMTSVNINATIKAMKYSMRGIEFGDAVLITHKKPLNLPKNIRYEYTSQLTSINDFNYKMVYDLGDYIKTDFALIVHADGFVVHPEMWRDEFLDYDYVGAPWPLPAEGHEEQYKDIYGNTCRVGNSAGIRSKRLMDYPKSHNVPWEAQIEGDRVWYNEDVFICCKIRHLLEADGMRIAPIDVAKYYAHEYMVPEVEGITPFAFHKWLGTNAQYPRFVKDKPIVVIKKIVKRLIGWEKRKGYVQEKEHT